MTSNALTAGRDGNGGRVKFGKELRKEFLFDEKYLNLNHGSFGTYPKAIRTVIRSFQDQVEARPDKFIRYEYPHLLDEARAAIAKVLNAPVETLVFVQNATTGINTVLRNLIFKPGDKILYFATIYGSCHKGIEYVTETTPAESASVDYEYPVEDDWLVEKFKEKVREERGKGNRVKIALFDTVVSMPGVRMPFERLVEACREEGVLSLVDAAHAVGHIDLDLSKLDPDFFVSNCHKWLFVPRGCAIFHVPVRNQPLIRSTLPTSHGFIPRPRPGIKINNPFAPVGTKSAWVSNFEVVGTIDNAPYLCIPAAIEWRESIGGEAAIISYCFRLAKDAANRAAEMLGTEILDNRTHTLMNCPMSNTKLPLEYGEVERIASKAGLNIEKQDVAILVRNWMSKVLVDEYGTFMALFFHAGAWWVRWSAQVYLELSDFEWAAEVLKKICERVMKGEFVAIKAKL